MNIEKLIKPVNNGHSIKEVVISVILAQPILKPERYKTIIENDFKDIFQQFEDIKQVHFEFRNENGVIERNLPEIKDNVGFRFSAFEKGQVVRALQGINELNRTFISYHCLKYESWDSFYKEYIDKINVIANKMQNDIFANAFSLHYIDEFSWIDESNLDLNIIFNNNSKYLPKEFFNSINTNYSLITECRIKDSTYLDRLGIILNTKIKPIINISHNVTIPLKDLEGFKKLVNSDSFKTLLFDAHEHNKNLLKDILKKEITNLIHLTNE